MPSLDDDDTLGASVREQETAAHLVAQAPLVPPTVMGAGSDAAGSVGRLGRVRVFETGGAAGVLSVSVEASGLPEGSHGWGLYRGSCEGAHEIVARFDPSSGPLVVGTAGYGEAASHLPTSSVDARRIAAGGYGVWVGDHERPLACAPLSDAT